LAWRSAIAGFLFPKSLIPLNSFFQTVEDEFELTGGEAFRAIPVQLRV
jgi:hypothetical protein